MELQQDAPEVDEQGAEWPPSLCPLVRIREFGGKIETEYQGRYGVLEDFEFSTKYYSVRLGASETLWCNRREFETVNQFALDLLESIEESLAPPVEDQSIHDLLQGVYPEANGPIFVPYYAIADWSEDVRSKIVKWGVVASRSLERSKIPPAPAELKPWIFSRRR